MKRIEIYGNQELITEDLNFLQSYKDTEIKTRTTDIFQSGIVSVTSTFTPFTITVDATVTSTFNIGPGIAYNDGGQRVEILSSEYVVADVATTPTLSYVYSWTNSADSSDTQAVPEKTPYSTGNRQIKLKILSSPIANYVFVDYIETLVDTATAYGDWSSKFAKYSTDQETDINKYCYKKNGYRVIVETDTTNGVDITGKTPKLKIPLYSNAIYVGTITPSGTTYIASGDITMDGVANKYRQHFKQDPKTVKIYTPTNDTDKTTVYASNGEYSLGDHIKCIGSAVNITPNNPHGQTIYDLGYTGADVASHMSEGHVNYVISGITSKTATGSLLYAHTTDSTTVRVEGLNDTNGEAAVVDGTRVTSVVAVTLNPTHVGLNYIYMTSAGVISYAASYSTITNNNYLYIGVIKWDGASLMKPGASSYAGPNDVIDERVFGDIDQINIAQGAYNQGSSLIPVGGIVQFLDIPVGWLELNGALIDYNTSVQYYNLVTYLQGLGYTGISTTSVTLPDMQGKFALGRKTGTYNVGTSTPLSGHQITLVAANIPAHTHSGTSGAEATHYHNWYAEVWLTAAGGGSKSVYAVPGAATAHATSAGTSHTHDITTIAADSPVGTATTITITPPYTALIYCMKY